MEYSKENLWGFHLGMPIEILTTENEVYFYGQLDHIDDKVFCINDIAGEEVPAALYQSPVKLRGFLSTDTVTVQASVRGTSSHQWKVGDMESLYIKESRESFRQPLDVTAQVGYANERIHKNAKRDECRVLDASVGGIRISSKGEYNINDWLRIRGAAITEEEEPFTLIGSVRWVRETEDGDYQYGIQFTGEMEATEQDRLCRAIFILQRKERKKLSR